jgi:peptide/nickel transport system substrate-binding protein
MGIGLPTCVLALAAVAGVSAQSGGELRFCLRADPKTFDPLLAEEEPSDTIRFLTGGVLIRFNRQSQKLEPELAASWTVRDQGKRIDFVLRRNVRFSDGTPFGPADVVAVIRRIMDPNLHSGIADSFRSAGGDIRAEPSGPDGISMFFSAPVAGLELLFDQLAISSSRAGAPQNAVLGPFMLAEHKGGQYVLLRRNPYYWKTDSSGKKLPYLNSVRIDIQANRETELLRFRRGELQLFDKLEPEAYQRLQKEAPSTVRNAGPSLDAEFFWFNQAPDAPLPVYKQRWMQSKLFRRAVSAGVNREDIVRLVYRGYARPAAGPASPANSLWVNSKLIPQRYDPQLARKLLQEDGFRLDGDGLRDREGNAVEFSLITNAGSNTRTQIGTMLQEDLKKIGIRLNFTPIEFQSLIERITRTQQYEACLLGLSNTEIDLPNSQMNVWLSSGDLHAWNPKEAKPATSWEAEIDRLMQAQHTEMDRKARKAAFDRVQELIAEQAPIVYLVHPDVLMAISPALRNAAPSALPPHLFWNIESLWLAGTGQRREN